MPEIAIAPIPATAGLTTAAPLPNLDGLPAPPLKVFISYKSRDAQAALEIKNKLEGLSAGKMEVFVSCSPESLPPTAKWRDKIVTELREAHCLLFLYTDPKQTWDWCFYETGFFDGSRTENALLYVLHAKGTPPPKPLEGLQGVQIDQGEAAGDVTTSLPLDEMLETLFCKSTNPPINPEFKSSADFYDLLKAAVCKPFLKPANLPSPKSFLRRLQILLPQASIQSLLARAEIPATARATGDANSLTLFKRVEKADGWLWSELEAELKEHSIQEDSSILWVQRLACAMQDALSGHVVAAGLPLFFCPFDLRAYRPSLSKLEYQDDGSACFELVFVDLPRELEAYPPDALGKTAHLINLARMFRWGALLPFRNELDDRTKPADVLRIGNCILQAISNVSAESMNRGIRRQHDILSAFKPGDQQDTIESLITRWPPCFEKFQAGLVAKDAAQMKSALEEMLVLNRSMLRTASLRFAELIEEMAKAEEIETPH